jgi:uncharacterized membrane protein
MAEHLRAGLHGRYLVIGLLTAAPLLATWLIIDFLFSSLARIGRPAVAALARAVRPREPEIADWLMSPTAQSVAAALVVLLLLYLLGWAASRMIGRHLIHLFEAIVARIPFVNTIYHNVKKLLNVVGERPAGRQRVVLIDFPSPEMKAIGVVMRFLRDADTDEELAAVYVPTSPNPTSGYVEVVPVSSLTATDWTFDQAMGFVVTGGSSSPEKIHYRKSARSPASTEKGISGEVERSNS